MFSEWMIFLVLEINGGGVFLVFGFETGKVESSAIYSADNSNSGLKFPLPMLATTLTVVNNT